MGKADSPNVKEGWLTKSGLKERGWTEGLISSVLGRPDRTELNPHHRSGPRMQLFARHRVEAAEATPEYRARVADRNKRQDAAKKAVATKRARTAASVAGGEITLPRLDRDQLIRAACRHWNDRQLETGRSEGFASPSPDAPFLARLAVNYLRHEMTCYLDWCRF